MSMPAHRVETPAMPTCPCGAPSEPPGSLCAHHRAERRAEKLAAPMGDEGARAGLTDPPASHPPALAPPVPETPSWPPQPDVHAEFTMAPRIPPPWEQDGPPYRCEHPGCTYQRDTLQAIGMHRRKAHGLPGQTAASRVKRGRQARRERVALLPRPGGVMPAPATLVPTTAAALPALQSRPPSPVLPAVDIEGMIDLAALVTTGARDWTPLTVLELRAVPMPDGRLEIQYRLVDSDAG